MGLESLNMSLRNKDYWEQHYANELHCFTENKDPGDIWFGRRLNNKIAEYIAHKINNDQTDPPYALSVLDIGCGNSYLLITLAQMLRKPAKLTGIDFSHSAVQLSRGLIEEFQDKKGHPGVDIQVNQCDFLNPQSVLKLSQTNSDIIVDKGTLDAILLIAAEDPGRGPLTSTQLYINSLTSLAHHGTIFILCSCNQTPEELKNMFQDVHNGLRFSAYGTIETPSISFGGKTGSQVACVLFKLLQQ